MPGLVAPLVLLPPEGAGIVPELARYVAAAVVLGLGAARARTCFWTVCAGAGYLRGGHGGGAGPLSDALSPAAGANTTPSSARDLSSASVLEDRLGADAGQPGPVLQQGDWEKK